MPDRDDVLSAEADHPPGPAPLVRRGTRRRRTRDGALVAVAAVAVAVVGWTAVSLPGGGSTPSPSSPPTTHPTHPSPSRTPSSSDEDDRATARAVVGSPHARIGGLSVIADHPERRIAEWYVCRESDCERRENALVVTGNGFADAHVVQLPANRSTWSLEPAGRDHFAVALNGGRRMLVDLSGRVTRITVGGTSGPVAGDEVPLRAPVRSYLAVDPATGAAHPLSVPAGTEQLLTEPSGQLRVLTARDYAWSDDGGATWHTIGLPQEGTAIAAIVPTASDSVHAVLQGGDGATLFPWDRILRSTDGEAWTSYPGPSVAKAYVDSPVVLPDGRLLIDVEAWSDQAAGKPAPRPVGLYAANTWSSPAPVSMGAPFGVSPGRSVIAVFDVAVTAGSVTVYARTPDQAQVFASSDGGATWRPVRAR
jgi:hypothetical protein